MANAGKKIAIGCGVGCGVFAVLTLALLFWLGVAIDQGVVPDSEAVPAGKIPARVLKDLREMGVVEPGEEVLYFYSAAILSIRGDGNLFTDRRVISYEGHEGELTTYAATYDEIESLDFAPSESWTDDSLITVYKTDGTSFALYVASDAGRDRDFYDKLMKRWKTSQGEELPLESPP